MPDGSKKPSGGSRDWFENGWRNVRRYGGAALASLRDTIRREPRSQVAPPDFAVVDIERDDDIATVCGRIDAAEREHVALVVPANARLRGAVALARVRRHAVTRGKSVAIVTRKRAIRSEARAARMLSAGSLEQVRFSEARRRRLFALQAGRVGVEVREPSLRGALTFGLAGLTVFGGACAAYLVAPSADVTLYPQTEPIAMTLDFRADPVATSVVLGSPSTLPADRVEARLPVRLVVPTSGTTTVGASRASGEVTFTNGGDSDVTVASGTVLRSDGGVTFATTEPVDVAPRDEATAPAQALIAGTVGNVDSESITQIVEGPADVSVTNEDDFSGGEDDEVPAVADEDFADARALASLALRQDGAEKLMEEEAGRYVVLPGTETPRLETEHFDRAVDEPGEFLTIEGDGILTGIGVRIEDLETLAALAVELSRGPDTMLLPESSEYVVLGEPSRNDETGVISVRVSVTGRIAPRIDTGDVKDAISGMNRTEAAVYLATQFHLVLPPDIDITPGWIDGISRFGWRVDVHVRAVPPATPTPEATDGDEEDDQSSDDVPDGTATPGDEDAEDGTPAPEDDEG